MPLQYDPRPVNVNGTPLAPRPYKVAADDDSLYFNQNVLNALGVEVIPADDAVDLHLLPRIHVGQKPDGSLAVTRIPGSPRYDQGYSNPRILVRDNSSNVLTLNADVHNGQLVSLDGTLHDVTKDVKLDVSVHLRDGHLDLSGSITVAVGDFQATVTNNNGNFTGHLKFDSGNVQLDIQVAAGNTQPLAWSVGFTIHF